MNKRGLFLLLLLLWFPLQTFADVVKPVLDRVLYQASAEAWVNTQTAEVVLSVNASLNEEKLAQAHNDMLEKFNKIAKAEWHITQFNRLPNESGLEQLQVMAEARLPETALADLREQAKKVSRPGETFKVESITFVPTLAEIESVRKQLRSQIYLQVQQELAELNKTYPTQKYVVHTIDFLENMTPRAQFKGAMMAAGENMSVTPGPLLPVTVANKMTINAKVVLASINQ
jgi:hypothetical protein